MHNQSLHEHGNIQASLDYVLTFRLPLEYTLLDIGCHYGTLVYALYNAGYRNVHGIDIKQKAVEKGRETYPVINNRLKLYDGRALPFSDKSLDGVLMFDVMEHIPALEDFMKTQLVRVLKPGGMLIFQTPNKRINIPWEILKQRSLHKYKRYHVSLQTPGSLENLLYRAGFEQVVTQKSNIMTPHNRQKTQSVLGAAGYFMLRLLQAMPLGFFPNIWGYARKK